MKSMLRAPFSILTLFLAHTPVLPNAGGQNECKDILNSENTITNVVDWSSVPNWSVAALTLGLLIVSAFQWKAMVAATNETKRSVDTLMASERGRLIFWGAHYDTKTKRVHWGYKNIGRGPAIVLADTHTTKHYGEFEKPTLHDTKRLPEDRKWGIVSDDEIATWPGKHGHAYLEPCEYELSSTQIAEIGKSIQLILKGNIVYETHLRQKFRIFFAVSFHPIIEGDYRCIQGMYGGEVFNYEEEIT